MQKNPCFLQQTGGELEEAAFGLGANRVTVTRLITLPLITANLAAGALLAFAFAMLEVSDSIVLAQREAHYPVTKAIAALSERLGDGPSVAAAMGGLGDAVARFGPLHGLSDLGKPTWCHLPGLRGRH